MAIYRLLDDAGEVVCEGHAQNDEHALAVLGAKLGKPLAFDGSGPILMMQRIEANQMQWRSREGIAVYIVDPPAN